MYAAVVTSFDCAPRFQEFPTPVPVGEHHMLIDVLAVGLHPRVRSQANGSHYTSTDELPLIPGIDGVGRGPDGLLRYFVLPDTTMGAMAERTVIDRRRSIVLPETTDPVTVAAAMNPAMSAWVALRQRIHFQVGQNVLVLGATGSAGAMAVQVAKMFGANQIVAAGRNAPRLAELKSLGATETVLLDDNPEALADRLGRAGGDIDVVLDYVWGEPTTATMAAVIAARNDDGRALSWIQIGSVAGPTAAIPSDALRSTKLQIVGSGQGSVSPREILAELPGLVAAITSGSFDIDVRPMPLADVETAWSVPDPAQRIVLVP